MSSDSSKKKKATAPAAIVEIGGNWVKMAAMEMTRHGLAINRLHLEHFDTIGPTVSGSVARAAQQLKFPKGPIVGCLPRQMVNIRILELPSIDAEEIADMVDLQVGKQTPYSRDEIVSDYRIIGSGRKGYTRVMLAIVQRNVLRERFYMLEESGFDVAGMSISTEGLFNWYSHAAARLGGGAPMILVDVDSFYSDFLVIANGSLCFTRSILVGADQLLEDYDRWKDKLCREAQHSLETLAGEMPDLQPERIVLSGAANRIEGLDRDLGAHLKLEATTTTCLDDVVKYPDQPALSESRYAPVSLTALIGMGLNPGGLEFSLIPDSVRLKKELSTRARGLTVLAMLVMAFLVSASSIATLQTVFKKTHRDALHEQLVATTPQVRKIDRMRELVNVVRRRQATRFSAVTVLGAIHGAVPENVFFDDMNVDCRARTGSLSGIADTRRDIRSLVNRLESSDLFEDVQESGTQMDRNRKLRFRVSFSFETEQP